jgi:hypothetical protein
MRLHFTSLIYALALAACAGLPPSDPTSSKSLTVQPLTDAAKTLTVKSGMVFYSDSSRTHGIRFPPGRYTLVAEDNDYWFFSAPAPIEFRDFKNGVVTDAKDAPGGIMISRSFTKSLMTMTAGAGYTDSDTPATKDMVWKLGGEFQRLEGSEWSKSF